MRSLIHHPEPNVLVQLLPSAKAELYGNLGLAQGLLKVCPWRAGGA